MPRRAGALLTLCLGTLLLAACASSLPPSGSHRTTTTSEATTTSTPPAGSSTTTTTAPGPACGVVPSPDAVLTSGTEPCAVTTHVGVTIHISLDTGFIWGDPTSNSGVIRVSAINRPSQGGGLGARLTAVAVGQADIMSTGTVACAPGQPCPALARLWGLHVTVVQSTSAPTAG